MVNDVTATPKLDAALRGLPRDQQAIGMCGYAAMAHFLGNDDVTADVLLRRASVLCPELTARLDAMLAECADVPKLHVRDAAWARARLDALARSLS